ncbi:hypothetical protein [Thermophilibacter sp.]
MVSERNRQQSTKNVAFLSIYVFLCLFAPPVLPDVNLVLVIALLSVPYLLANAPRSKGILSSRAGRSFCAWFGAFAAYWVIIMLVNVLLGDKVYTSDYVTSAYSFFLVMPTCLVCAVTALVYAGKHGLTSGQVVKAFICAGLAQAVIALAAFFDQGIKDTLTEIMFQNTGTTQMQEGSWIAERRFYGFANSMLDLYGFGTGVIAALPAFLVLIDREASKMWLFAVPFLLVVPALNARTGLVLFVVAIMIASLYAGKSSGLSIISTMLTALIIALVAAVIIGVIATVRPEIIDWLLGDILGTTQHNTLSILFGEGFWNLPEPLMVITGTGHTVYGVPGFSHSDVGYVNELWRTGVIGLVLLFGAFARPTMIALKGAVVPGAMRYLVVATALCLAVVAVKCMPITHSGGMILLLSLVLLCGVAAEQPKGGENGNEHRTRKRSHSRL